MFEYLNCLLLLQLLSDPVKLVDITVTYRPDVLTTTKKSSSKNNDMALIRL